MTSQTPVQARSYPPEYIDAIQRKQAVCEALSACQTVAEVNACALAHKDTYEALKAVPDHEIFAIHIRNLAERRRAELTPKAPQRIFPTLKDPALEAAAMDWPAMHNTLKHSEEDFERNFSFSVMKGLDNPAWVPSPRQRPLMKRMHRDWKTSGEVLE